MTPSQAADGWPKVEELADEFNLKIVGPAVNYCDQCVDIPGVDSDSDPISYLDAFFAACPDCRVDYIAVHNYMCYAGPLADYIARFKKYKKKIWLTEFACWDQSTITLDMQKSLVIGAIDYLENDTNVFRYSWFTGDRYGKWPYLDIYGTQPGQLTELGQLYLNFNSTHDENAFVDIPGRIEAESYAKMLGIQLEGTQDVDGMANVGYFDAGDWLQYNVNVAETGEYYIYIRISSNATTAVSLKENGTVLNSLSIPSSGGWQNWKTYSFPVTLEKGKHKLQLHSSIGKFNINWIAFSKGVNTAPTLIADEDTVITLPENSIYLTCTANDMDGNKLTYKWSKQTGPTSGIIVSPTGALTEITGLTEGSYTFRVTVSDGIETVSDMVKVTVQATVGMVDIGKKDKYRIYPNPTSGFLNIEIVPGTEETPLSFIAFDGRVVLNDRIAAGESNHLIDMTNFPKGLYLIRIGTSTDGFKTKVIKE
jgi:hypothetical protein